MFWPPVATVTLIPLRKGHACATKICARTGPETPGHDRGICFQWTLADSPNSRYGEWRTGHCWTRMPRPGIPPFRTIGVIPIPTVYSAEFIRYRTLAVVGQRADGPPARVTQVGWCSNASLDSLLPH